MIVHDMNVEERLFTADIDSLRCYDEGFKAAYDGGLEYELTINLPKLFEICPRKTQKKKVYERLVRFLNEKGITLRIQSRKKQKTKLVRKTKTKTNVYM